MHVPQRRDGLSCVWFIEGRCPCMFSSLLYFCLCISSNFSILLSQCGQPARTFPLCPNCFNSSEWLLPGQDEGTVGKGLDEEDEHKERQVRRVAGGRSLVLECPHPDTHPLIRERTVAPDPDSGGALVLDPTPNKYRLVSTRDPTIIYFPKEVEKVVVMDRVDEVTGCHLMKIEWKEGASPLPDGSTKHICNFCTDPIIQGKVRVYHGSERLKASGRGGRGRGRGGGRGRGRGRR